MTSRSLSPSVSLMVITSLFRLPKEILQNSESAAGALQETADLSQSKFTVDTLWN